MHMPPMSRPAVEPMAVTWPIVDSMPACMQSYSRDLLGFLFLVLTLVASITSLRPARSPVLLNRTQTEEWKGWMQVQALLPY